MKAIILAAGIGRRMGALTNDCHKTLLEVDGRTILGRILDGLRDNGVTDICVVTGYRAGDVESYVEREYSDLHCQFVRNEQFATTNNVHSMALALDAVELEEDIILIESDLVFDPDVLARLIKSDHPNVALVDRYKTGMDGTVVTVAHGGVITQIIPGSLQDVDFEFSDKYKTLNIYKFDKDFCRNTFRRLLSYYTRAMDGACYYELILGILIYMQQVQVHAEILDGERWSEVDDPNDLRAANFLFLSSGRRQYLESSCGGYWNADITDFSFIRNMHFPTPSILSQIRASLPELVFNPGSTQTVLNEKLAYFLQCRSSNVHLLNGASQFFSSSFLRSFEPGRVLLPNPTYDEYSRLYPGAQTYDDRGGIDLDEVVQRADDVDLVIVVNPNNPTGTTVRTADLCELATRIPTKTILVDESYIDFSGQPSILPWAESANATNVVVLKSLSSSLGVPGVRLGYVFTVDQRLGRSIAEDIPRRSVNSIAEYFLEVLLKFRGEFDLSLERTIADRELFSTRLSDVNIVDKVFPGGGNFILVSLRLSHRSALALADEILRSDDVYVKDVSDQFGDGGAYWRVAVRTNEENARLCDILRARSASASWTESLR